MHIGISFTREKTIVQLHLHSLLEDIVRHSSNSLHRHILKHKSFSTWSLWLTLGHWCWLSSKMGLVSTLVILLAATQECLVTTRWLDVLHSNMNSLLNISSIDLLEQFNSYSALGHIPHTSSLSMVKLMGHSLHNHHRHSQSYAHI